MPWYTFHPPVWLLLTCTVLQPVAFSMHSWCSSKAPWSAKTPITISLPLFLDIIVDCKCWCSWIAGVDATEMQFLFESDGMLYSLTCDAEHCRIFLCGCVFGRSTDVRVQKPYSTLTKGWSETASLWHHKMSLKIHLLSLLLNILFAAKRWWQTHLA